MANRPTAPEHAPGPAGGSSARPVDVVLVGAGETARSWLVPLRRSARLRAVGTVARSEAAWAPQLPGYGTLAEAMKAHPAAVFAIALPPRGAVEAALQLVAMRRAGVVEAPLHETLLDASLDPGADQVRVAHGWVTLPGLRAIKAVMRRVGGGRLSIEIAGLPEDDHADWSEALVHAAALIRSLVPAATASSARPANGGALDVELGSSAMGREWTLRLRLLARGRRLAVRVDTDAEPAVWSWENDRESVMLGSMPLVASHATPPAPVRALAQLLPDSNRGDGLAEAAAALRLAKSCLALLPAQLPIGDRVLRQSASIARRRPADLLGCLGLRGALPVEAAAAPVLDLPPLPEPFELWAFRAGVKPVAFLTVAPADVDRTLSWFGEAHHERRERRVKVEAQDRWTDDRIAGEPRVELYIARDPTLARRMVRLQAEEDPTRTVVELGALCGYPPCCVEAFARQDDRANNTRNRYYSHARTLAPDGSTTVPWPWELNNLHTMVAPFYPCSYRCERALAWTRAAIEVMGHAHPEFVEKLRRVLSAPVLYFTHEHQIILEGEYSGGGVGYRGVAMVPSSSPQLASLATIVGRGDRLSFDDRLLRVERGGKVILELERTDPGLGFLAPFGAV